jgi:hypothetical protein
MCNSDERVWAIQRHGRLAGVADALELGAEHLAVDRDGRQRVVEWETPGVDERAQHVGMEASAFLVGEKGDDERPPRLTPAASRVATTSSPPRTPRLPS